MNSVVEKIKGGLIVSCQAYPGEPLRHPETMAQMAMAAVEGGAIEFGAKGYRIFLRLKGRLTFP